MAKWFLEAWQVVENVAIAVIKIPISIPRIMIAWAVVVGINVAPPPSTAAGIATASAPSAAAEITPSLCKGMLLVVSQRMQILMLLGKPATTGILER